MPTPPSLCNLPNELAENIFNRVDFMSIQNLRKVCYDLRNRIDDIKPEANLIRVDINVTDCEIQFMYRSTLDHVFYETLAVNLGYQKTVESGRTMLRCGDSEKIVNGDYMELALRDFLLILKFQKKSKYRILFDNGITCSNHFLQFLENLKSFLALENRLLKVAHFNINAIDQKSVITALSLINPQSIKSISLYNWGRSIQPMEFFEMMEMEHWKTAEHFTSDFIISGVSLRNLLHFSHFMVMLQSISAEELFDLNKICLNSSEAEWFSIQYETFEGREQFLERMGPALRMRFDDAFEWFFRISTTDDYVLWIKLEDETSQTIIFDRLSKDNVPEDAVIQD